MIDFTSPTCQPVNDAGSTPDVDDASDGAVGDEAGDADADADGG